MSGGPQGRGPSYRDEIVATELFSSHFGLTGNPFSLVPDPSYLFWSPLHRKAYTVLEYGMLTGAPITVLTGEVGTGKTTLIRNLLDNAPDDLRLGLLSNAQANRGDLYRWVLNAFDIPTDHPDDPVSMFQAFQDFVIEEYAQRRRVVVIIDEAQNLGAERLEELRMLTNINSGSDELLQIILVGQPQLKALLTSPDMRQFAQRVAVYFDLSALDQKAVGKYIRHRLKRAGGTGEEFEPDAVRRVYEETGGLPRIINKLCDLSLVYAASAESARVTESIVNDVLNDGLLIEFGSPALLRPDVSHRDAAE